jgi:hypothetical protein
MEIEAITSGVPLPALTDFSASGNGNINTAPRRPTQPSAAVAAAVTGEGGGGDAAARRRGSGATAAAAVVVVAAASSGASLLQVIAPRKRGDDQARVQCCRTGVACAPLNDTLYCTRLYTSTPTHTCTHTRTHALARTHAHTYAHTHAHTHTHTHTHTRTHTCIHTQTHTRTRREGRCQAVTTRARACAPTLTMPPTCRACSGRRAGRLGACASPTGCTLALR